MSLDQAFLEKVVLLVLTALITGLGIPYVLKRVEDRKLRQQRSFEADLARQGKIIEAQSKFLDDLSRLLWTWRYLAKKVVYYGALENAERYELARRQYDEQVWDILNEFRAEISRARRLVSEGAYQRLDALYDYVVHDIDLRMSDITRADKLDGQKSRAMADRFSVEVSRTLDDALDELASELHLKVRA
jgi:hypothetical protein